MSKKLPSGKALLARLHKLAEDLGRVPTDREINAANLGAVSNTYRRLWGSRAAAFEAASVRYPRVRTSYRIRSDAEMLAELCEVVIAAGEMVKSRLIDGRASLACSEAYRKRFGTRDALTLRVVAELRRIGHTRLAQSIEDDLNRRIKARSTR